MRFSLRSILEVVLFAAIYLAMFDAAFMTILFGSVVVSAGMMRFCRCGLALPRIHAAVVGIVACSFHVGVFRAVLKARVSVGLRGPHTWANWYYGGGWPSVIGHALEGALMGLIQGLIVAVGFLFFVRLNQRSPSVAKRFIATTVWLFGAFLGTVSAIKLHHSILSFFHGEELFHPVSDVLATATGFALVWAAFKLPAWLSHVEHRLRRES